MVGEPRARQGADQLLVEGEENRIFLHGGENVEHVVGADLAVQRADQAAVDQASCVDSGQREQFPG